MRLVTPPIEIDENDPFGLDKLERKSFGEALKNLIINTSDELVISLDGKWGEGKTTFVHMWQGLLKQSNIPNVYINAFENDYIDDAFIGVASAINQYGAEHIKETENAALTKFKDHAKKVGGQLLSITARIGIKAATFGVIDAADLTEELKDIRKDLADSTSKLAGKVIEERLDSHKEDLETVETFKQLLAELPSQLKDNEEGHPLVIIIDELDRCRPTFAVEMIEKIKHLFSVENVVFVLVMNKEQLEASIRCVYGEIDSHTYLQKFITIETRLPKIISDERNNDYINYIQHLHEQHEFQTLENYQYETKYLGVLARHFDLSLRELEKTFTILAVFYSTFPKNTVHIQEIITLLSVLKVKNQPLYKKVTNQTINLKDFYTEIGWQQVSDRDAHLGNYHYDLNHIMKWMEFLILSKAEVDQLEDSYMSYFQKDLYRMNKKSLIPFYTTILETCKYTP